MQDSARIRGGLAGSALWLALAGCGGSIGVAPKSDDSGADDTAAPDEGGGGEGGGTEGGGTEGGGAEGGGTEGGGAEGGGTEGGGTEGGGGEGGGDDTGGTSAETFGFLSLNLHCLKLEETSYASNDERMAAVAALAAAEDVAVIAAQELCDNGDEDSLSLLDGALEAATGTAWSTAATVAHTAWEGSDDEAEESVGLLVRGALSDAGSVTYAEQGGLTRVATYATLPDALGGLVVWSVHLDVGDEDARTAQGRETAGAALTLADPSVAVLVAGDFNDIEGSDAHSAMVAAGYADLSDGLGADRIDHVFAHRGAPVAATAARLAFDGDAEPAVSDHPGVLVTLAPSDGEDVAVTRITAAADVGWGKYLSVRGDTAPLDWDWGWPAQPLSSDSWRLVLTELDAGSFEYKVLVSDEAWMSGDNATGEGGADNEVSPTF